MGIDVLSSAVSVTGSVTDIKPGKHNDTSTGKAGGLLMRSISLQTRPRRSGLTHHSRDWCLLLAPALEQIHSQLFIPAGYSLYTQEHGN